MAGARRQEEKQQCLLGALGKMLWEGLCRSPWTDTISTNPGATP